ncbi:MAG TPA: hypothetical protein VLH79_00990 [Chthonomonadales bacterium]|nr:hypothetical protein [Chthonomonadales bacterium]
MEFSSQTNRDALRQIARRIRATNLGVLFAAAVPYRHEGAHPHAQPCRVRYSASPTSCHWAEIMLGRFTGHMSQTEAQALARHCRRTGHAFVLTRRTYPDWDVAPDAPASAQSSARNAPSAWSPRWSPDTAS